VADRPLSDAQSRVLHLLRLEWRLMRADNTGAKTRAQYVLREPGGVGAELIPVADGTVTGLHRRGLLYYRGASNCMYELTEAGRTVALVPGFQLRPPHRRQPALELAALHAMIQPVVDAFRQAREGLIIIDRVAELAEDYKELDPRG
jgi:hypothetical protein